MAQSPRDQNRIPAALGVTNDANLTPEPLRVDPTTKRLLVDTTGGGSGTSATDDSAFTPGSTAVTPMGAFFDDVSPDSVDEGDIGAPRMSANRNLYVTIRDAAGNERGLNIDSSGALTVTGVTGATQYDEDTLHVSGDKVTLAGVVRNDAGTALSGDGDRTVLSVNSAGALYVTGGGGGTQYVEDDAAAANPTGTQIVSRRRDTLSSEVTTDGDVIAVNSTSKGELYVKHADALPITDNSGSLTVDGTLAVTQSGNWSVRLQDGSGNALNSTSSALNVYLAGQGGAVTVTATDLDIRNLVAATDSVSISDGTDTLSVVGNGDSITGQKGIYVFGSDGANTRPVHLTSSGDLIVTQSTASSLNATVRLNDGSGNSLASTSSALNVDPKVTESTFDHGSKSGIGTTAVQITTSSVSANQGVLVKAASTNTGLVYVGNSDVTAATVDATDGYELTAGENMTVEIDNANKVYVIGSASGQRIFWVAV